MSTQSPYGETSRERERSPYAAEPPAAESFDPYRFGAPEHPVPPEYAPPGYRPPPLTQPPPMPQPPQYQYGTSPYSPQPPNYYPAPPDHQYPQPRPGNGKAIAALVLGLLSIVFCFASFLDLFLIIPAIVFGSLALNDAKRKGGSGRGVAVSGLTCAMIGALLAITVTVWLYPKVASCANDYPSGSSEYNTCIRDIVK